MTGVDKDIDQAAIDAVNRWRFVPGTYKGNAVDVELTVTVNFRLSANSQQPLPSGNPQEQKDAADDFRNIYADASEAYNRGDYVTAANLFRKSVSIYPENGSVWNHLGRALLAMNQLDAGASADFAVKLSAGKAPEFHQLNEDKTLAKVAELLPAAQPPVTVPESSGVQVPLRGTLTCHSEESLCRFVFMSSEEAVNLARNEMAMASSTPNHQLDPQSSRVRRPGHGNADFSAGRMEIDSDRTGILQPPAERYVRQTRLACPVYADAGAIRGLGRTLPENARRFFLQKN